MPKLNQDLGIVKMQRISVGLSLVSIVCGSLNLYLATEEMKKLLGLEKELFYVRDGTVNKYALGFLIPVPKYVNSLEFTWAAGNSKNKLQYNISTASSLVPALATPLVNISRVGAVPEREQTWSVGLHCSGLEAGEVVVTITIDIIGLTPSLPQNVTRLKLNRKKTCHLYTSIERGLREETVVETEQVPTYVIFFAGVGVCLFVLVLVLSLVIGTWLRSTKQKPGSRAEVSKTTEYTSLPPPPPDLALRRQKNSGSGPAHTMTEPGPAQLSCRTAPGPRYMTSTLLPRTGGDGLPEGEEWHGEESITLSPPIEELVVNRLDLTLGDLLMEGTFGRVYQGRLGPRDVIVKTIVMGSSEAQAVKLINDGSLLYPVQHKHVLPLLATTSDGSSPMMIYEYLQPGNMKKWLSGCHQPVSTHQCVSIGLQLLSALRHIHRHNIVHKDVAARNCYLGPGLSVKLSDPALSKDLFPNDYHCLGDNENRPVKWMAVETIGRGGEVTTACDVWAWGVTMWEVLTRAQQPFPDVDPFEMETYLMEGFRLHQPVNCPDQLYTVIVSCWAHTSHHRASVSTLYTHLNEFNTQLQMFV